MSDASGEAGALPPSGMPGAELSQARVSSPESLPADVEAVWAGGRLDATGGLAENTARGLIEAWGLERFRRSALHQVALAEAARSQDRSDFRAGDLKAIAKGNGKT